jgi:hypothetical protein
VLIERFLGLFLFDAVFPLEQTSLSFVLFHSIDSTLKITQTKFLLILLFNTLKLNLIENLLLALTMIPIVLDVRTLAHVGKVLETAALQLDQVVGAIVPLSWMHLRPIEVFIRDFCNLNKILFFNYLS